MPRPVRRKKIGWDEVKLDAYRSLQDNTLKATMREIEEKYGFQRSLRSWNYKLKEWNYSKNIPSIDMAWIVAKGKKRALEEDKDTEFSYKGARVGSQKIEGFKRKNTREVSFCVATPSDIEYNTPQDFQDKEPSLEEEMYKHSVSVHTLSVQNSILPVSRANSTLLDSENQNAFITNSDLAEVPVISMLDQYLSDETQPWSAYNPSHQLVNEGLVKRKQIIAKVGELAASLEEIDAPNIYPSKTQSLPLELCRIGAKFSANFVSAIDDDLEESFEIPALLRGVFDLTLPLAISHNENGELAKVTLIQESALARALYDNGSLQEAEYHFRRILAKEVRIMTQLRLGVILAGTSRQEEASSLMVSALSDFIVNSSSRSFDENVEISSGIELLLLELVDNSESDWSSLLPCISQIIRTVQKSELELGGTTNRLFLQLLTDGFSFAHGLFALNIMDPSKHLYRVLLAHSSQVEHIFYAIEMATAYREYGLLLMREGEWTTSAEKLLSACEYSLKSISIDRQLNALLRSDYIDLLPHLADAPDGEGSIRRRLGEMITDNFHEFSDLLQNTSRDPCLSPIEEFLFGSDSPVCFASFDTLDISDVAEFDSPVYLPSFDTLDILDVAQLRLPSIAPNTTHEDKSHTSTGSMMSWSSSEIKYGVTYSCTTITGISDIMDTMVL